MKPAYLLAALGLCLASAQPATAQSVTAPVIANPLVVQLQERVDELEQQVRALTGERERFTFELDKARTDAMRLQRLLNETEAERDALRAKLTMLETTPAPSPAEPPPKAPPQARSITPAPQATSSAPPAPVSAPAEPDAAWRAAQLALQRVDYPAAEAALKGFIAVHPNDRRVPEAKFWLGQTLLAREAHQDAAKMFTELLRAGGGPRPGETLGWLGVALRRMGQNEQACVALRQFLRDVPNAPANLKARAADEAKRGQC
jgi:TolA-binding protein